MWALAAALLSALLTLIGLFAFYRTPSVTAARYTGESKAWCVFFADTKFAKKRHQLEQDAKALDVFDRILAFDETALGQDFWERHGDFVRNNGRGFGYWIWKPWVILKTFEQCNEGDVVVYLDTGCVFNTKAMDRLREYIDRVRDAKDGLLAFRLRSFPEREWTKRRTLELLGCDEDCRNAKQIMATAFVIKKTPVNVELVEKWFDTLVRDNYIYVNDEKGPEEDTLLKEHRHDQSTWSLLIKNRDPASVIILDDETWPTLDHYPIWGLRQKF